MKDEEEILSYFIKPELLFYKFNQNNVREEKTMNISRNVEKHFTKFKGQNTRNKGKLLLPEGQYEKPVAITILIVKKCNMFSK